MPRVKLSLCLALALVTALPSTARAWNRGRATPFATVPGAVAAEGLEVDSSGNVYAATFGSGRLVVFDRDGALVRDVRIEGSSPNPLGMRFKPGTATLLVADFGSARVLAVNPVTGSSTVFMTLPATLPHPEAGAGLNDITFDRAGNVYVSDSFQGVVWRTGAGGGEATAWADDPLLRTTGVPPFGANGLRFNGAGTALFVANTGNDTVVKIPVAAGGAAGTPAVFANSINGADGLVIDRDDNLWVAANQADEIVVVDPTGRAIAKLGDFDGVDATGAPMGFLFPASLRFSGSNLLVTNLSLDLRTFDPSFTAVDSAWAAQVTRHTIARVKARIRPVEGAP